MEYKLSKIDDCPLSDFSNTLDAPDITFSTSYATLSSASRKLIGNTLLLTTFSFTASTNVNSNIQITIANWKYDNTFATIKSTIAIGVSALRSTSCQNVFNTNKYSSTVASLTFSIDSLQIDATYRGYVLQYVSALPSTYKFLSKIDDYIIEGSPLATQKNTFTDGSISNIYNISSSSNLSQIYLGENLVLTSFDFITGKLYGSAQCTITSSSKLKISYKIPLFYCIDSPISGYSINDPSSWNLYMSGFASGESSTHTCYLIHYVS